MYVVVAHAEADTKRAAQLVARLADGGINARAAGIAQTRANASRGEEAVGAVVLMWSRAASRVRRPRFWGDVKGPPLMIARLDDAPRPTALRRAQWFTLVDWRAQEGHRGFQALRAAAVAALAPQANNSSSGAQSALNQEKAMSVTRTKGMWSLFLIMALVAIGVTYGAGFWTPADIQALLPSRLISH
jgi:hypothetical protein